MSELDYSDGSFDNEGDHAPLHVEIRDVHVSKLDYFYGNSDDEDEYAPQNNLIPQTP